MWSEGNVFAINAPEYIYFSPSLIIAKLHDTSHDATSIHYAIVL